MPPSLDQTVASEARAHRGVTPTEKLLTGARAASGAVPEIWSVRLSLLGAILAVPGLALLLTPAISAKSPAHIVSFMLYGVGTFSMFLSSAAFHAKAGQERTFLKNLDYSAIGLKIAGTFTPYCAVALRTDFGYWILSAVWAIALFCAWLRLAKPELSKWTFIIAYLTMGWMGLLVAYPLYASLGTDGSLLTLLGGAFYTFGTLVFNRNEDDVEAPGFGPHDVWHLFILAGAATHWYVVWRYMLP
jgi:hemolysin III